MAVFEKKFPGSQNIIRKMAVFEKNPGSQYSFKMSTFEKLSRVTKYYSKMVILKNFHGSQNNLKNGRF